jgi:ABC-type Fe3+-hydroxamate transport system substrate-binding protein
MCFGALISGNSTSFTTSSMQSIKITDQLGNTFEIDKPFRRIISLVPSQTELLFDLNVADNVVGITKFCVHPAGWRKEKEIVGGTKNHQLEKIHDLKPDLIIANKEENKKELIEKLQVKYPVYVSDIANLDASYQMISDIGLLTGTSEQAINIIASIKNGFQNLNSVVQSGTSSITVAYCIWRNPWMWAGNDTFINYLLGKCYFNNVVEETRYPELNFESIQQLNPDYIFLSSEPYPFKEKHIAEIKKVLPNTRIMLVDGEYFSWYGSRLIKAPLYFISLWNQIHSNTL